MRMGVGEWLLLGWLVWFAGNPQAANFSAAFAPRRGTCAFDRSVLRCCP